MTAADIYLLRSAANLDEIILTLTKQAGMQFPVLATDIIMTFCPNLALQEHLAANLPSIQDVFLRWIESAIDEQRKQPVSSERYQSRSFRPVRALASFPPEV